MISRCRELIQRARVQTVYLVFDGVRVPLKADTNAERERRRRVNLAEARRLASMGRREEARERYNRCVKGTEEMARVVCAEVEKVFGRGEEAKVKCVFSPYEADAQLAKLCVDGVCHAVVTEDSDVLVYSVVCRCPFPIIYKLDRKDGSCDVVTMDWLLNPKFLPSSRRNRRKDDSDSEDGDVSENENIDFEELESNVVTEVHPSQVDYGDDDNMMYAPIRRTLTLPLGNVSASKSNSRARRSTKKKNTTGTAFLATLRSFAHKEANNPGHGCRLFIQACILSGCDYVPNRLSKVGPITAFKMVNDASHRKHSERFDRVMNCLPKGSILQKESADGIDNADISDDEVGGDFLSSCDSYNDMKERYLDLLIKSEAVFYYHLVRKHGSDSIVPLVSHKPPDSQDTAGHLSPSIVNFNSDLSFIGSVDEATKNKPTAAPPCPRNQARSDDQNNSGWFSANRSAGNKLNNMCKNHFTSHPTVESGSREPQKGTLRYAFSRPSNVLSRRTTNHSSTFVTVAGRTEQHKAAPPSLPAANATSSKKNNPFSSFARNSESDNIHCPSSSGTTPKLSKSAAKKLPATSPLFSPMGGNNNNFDYTEALSERKDFMKKSHIFDDEPKTNDRSKAINLIDGAPVPSDDENIESSQIPTSPLYDNTFDYEIIVESPPVESAISEEVRFSKYFDTRRESPRRVSTSPSYKPSYQGNSPDDAIDLSDEPESPTKEVSRRAPSCSRTSNLPKSSVNKRPFKSPYPINQHKSDTVARKRPRQVSAGALLAGFSIQRDSTTGKPLSARERLAARNRTGKTKTLSIQDYLKRKPH